MTRISQMICPCLPKLAVHLKATTGPSENKPLPIREIGEIRGFFLAARAPRLAASR